MTVDDQTMLKALRTVVGEAIAPLSARLETLSARMDAMAERMERLEAEQRQYRGILRLLLERSGNLASQIGAVKTQQYAFEERLGAVEERIEKGFRILKDDQSVFLKDMHRLRQDAARYQTENAQEVKELARRLNALEEGRQPE